MLSLIGIIEKYGTSGRICMPSSFTFRDVCQQKFDFFQKWPKLATWGKLGTLLVCKFPTKSNTRESNVRESSQAGRKRSNGLHQPGAKSTGMHSEYWPINRKKSKSVEAEGDKIWLETKKRSKRRSPSRNGSERYRELPLSWVYLTTAIPILTR